MLSVLLFLLHASLTAAAAPPRAVLFIRHSPAARERVYAELARRSDPESGADVFLSWLGKADVERMLQPAPADLAAAISLAEHHGATSHVLHGGDKLEVFFEGAEDIPPAFLREMRGMTALDTAAHTRRTALEEESPSVWAPSRRRSNRSSTASPRATDGSDPQSCLAAMDGITPTCIRTAYGLGDPSSSSSSSSSSSLDNENGDVNDLPATAGQAFIVNQPFHPSDLAQFQSTYHLPSNPVQTIVGPNSGSAGDEASLDSQYITATAMGNTPTTFVWLDGKMNNPFADWLTWAAKTADTELPRVHSLSLGAPETDVGAAIMQRMNTEMAALGLRGVTIVFASGDSGYQPVQKYGAASPYVLSVGGIFNGELRDQPLQADSLTTGGFAASPLNKVNATWQQAAIESYAKNRHPDSLPSKIPFGARAVPDVSAYDDFINIYQNGQSTSVSGTSAAAPIVAGMLAAINGAIARDANSANTTLGFVNPFVYQHAALFLDITKGDNRGIWAVEGYDPISGVGTWGVKTFTGLKAAALEACRGKLKKK